MTLGTEALIIPCTLENIGGVIMADNEVTFDDDFKEGFGFGMGFCLAVSATEWRAPGLSRSSLLIQLRISPEERAKPLLMASPCPRSSSLTQ